MGNTFNIFMNPTYDKNTVYLLTKESKKETKENILNISKKVEGLFLNMILKSVRKSFPKNDLFENNTTNMYEDIYDQAISQQISEKGFGLANIIAAQILKKIF